MVRTVVRAVYYEELKFPLHSGANRARISRTTLAAKTDCRKYRTEKTLRMDALANIPKTSALTKFQSERNKANLDSMEQNAPTSRSEITTAQLHDLHAACERLRAQLGRQIVGQRDVIDQLLIGILSGGHVLLVGVPGLAKTMLARSVADVLGLSFNRIQFTPDLMPADITGTEVIQSDAETGERHFRFINGPVFANIVLADEINRTPPKTQSALLEAMQEQQVTIGGTRHPLPVPFFVLATQNPIEQSGTYPLPEAQLDRFMLEIQIDYPDEEDEFHIVNQAQSRLNAKMESVLAAEELELLQQTVAAIPMAEHDIRYAIALVRATRRNGTASSTSTNGTNRPTTTDNETGITKYLHWGAGPRASEWLVRAARTHAAINGRDLATIDDIQRMAFPVLRHRLVKNYQAEAAGLSVDDLIQSLLDTIPKPSESRSFSGQSFLKK